MSEKKKDYIEVIYRDYDVNDNEVVYISYYKEVPNFVMEADENEGFWRDNLFNYWEDEVIIKKLSEEDKDMNDMKLIEKFTKQEVDTIYVFGRNNGIMKIYEKSLNGSINETYDSYKLKFVDELNKAAEKVEIVANALEVKLTKDKIRDKIEKQIIEKEYTSDGLLKFDILYDVYEKTLCSSIYLEVKEMIYLVKIIGLLYSKK